MAYLDDLYLVVPPERLDQFMSLVDRLWSELGLKVNPKKLKIWTSNGTTSARVPQAWRSSLVESLRVLGQRLRVKIHRDGEPYVLGGVPNLRASIDHLTLLQQRLFQLNQDGLGAAIVHQTWLYASGGAVTHLQATACHAAHELDELDSLQKAHLRCITERADTDDILKLAKLPLRMGGVALPDVHLQARAVFLSAQSRILPATAKLFPGTTVPEMLQADARMRGNIEGARLWMRNAGCPDHALPFGPEGLTQQKRSRDMTKPIQKSTAAALKQRLPTKAAAYMTSQASPKASQWLMEACPFGKPQPDPTWRTMMRTRLLQPSPGVPATPPVGGECANVNANGVRCARGLEGDEAHEHYCAVGGGALQRHNRAESWLASRMREYWCCPVREEYRTSEDIQGRPGRMDITARRPEGVLEVDVTIATVASVNQAELLRRTREPGRAARLEVKNKLRRYGPSVLAFAIEDTGRLAPGTCRLLRDLAGSQMESPVQEEYQKLVRELQHIVLAASASMLQSARGQPRTA